VETRSIVSQIEAFARAMATGDEAGMRAFLAEDYAGHRREPDEPSQADRWVAMVPDLVAAIPDLEVTVGDITENDGVHLLAILEGTHTGDLWGSPATGAKPRLEVPLTLRDTGNGWTVHSDAPPTALLGVLREVGVVPPADQIHLPPVNPIHPPEFLLKLAFTGAAADRPCSHLAQARVFEATTHECSQCVESGGTWPALRMCLVCGFVGCCDTSASKHMRAHHEATGHSIFRSIRLREGWGWCYEDAAFFERATLERLAAAAQA
jgi:hypothetical protein